VTHAGMLRRRGLNRPSTGGLQLRSALVAPRRSVVSCIALQLLTTTLLLPGTPDQASGLSISLHVNNVMPHVEPGAELLVRLIIIGPGDDLLSQFGHAAVWIEDTVAREGTTYNYGLSDIHQPGFLRMLAAGVVLSRPGVRDPAQMLEIYAGQKRSVDLLELNLTSSQKLSLKALLDLEQRWDSPSYQHDLFRTNCTTGIRDAIDLVLDGQLHARTAHVETGRTYRFHITRYTTGRVLLHHGLLIALSDAVDRPLSVWEELFLPETLKDHFLELTIHTDEDVEVPLVTSHSVLSTSATQHTPATVPPSQTVHLVLGLLLGAFMVALAGLASTAASARFCFGLLASAWLIVLGGMGVALAWLWALTDQQLTHYNENLLLFNPIALATAERLLVFSVTGAKHAGRYAQLLTGAGAVLSILAVLVKVLPNFDQANGPLILLVLPANLGLAWGVHRWLAHVHRTAPVPHVEGTGHPSSQHVSLRVS
jgi:hypothetical protein